MTTRIEYSTDEQLQQMHAEAIHVLHNLRYYTKYWEKYYGCKAKENKKNWEQKADELLVKYGLDVEQRMHVAHKPQIIKSDSDGSKDKNMQQM